MKLKAAFIFLSKEGNPETHHSIVHTDSVSVSTFAVRNYESAYNLVRKLIEQGFSAIELCGGFGIDGVAAVNKAAGGKAVVGVVRFDHHPGLGHQSGDLLFQ